MLMSNHQLILRIKAAVTDILARTHGGIVAASRPIFGTRMYYGR